jgi:hypothetical protein
MSATVTGDLPRQPGTANGHATTGTTTRHKRRTKRAAVAKAPVAVVPRVKTVPATRTAPIGIATDPKSPDLLTGFIRSMPKAGTPIAAPSREACKATFAALIDWLYPQDAQAA